MNGSLFNQIMLQLFLILLNAFFACTEIAVISLNDLKLKRDAENGKKSAQYLVKLTSQPARFLATIQVGITLAGFLASAFAANNFADELAAWLVGLQIKLPAATLNALSVVFITLLLSYFTLVLGELVPKRIAMQKAEPLAMAFSRIIYIISKAAAPVVWLLTKSTNAVIRILGMNPNARNENVTEEEIKMMVDSGEEEGAIAPEEGEMIDNVLDLSDKTAVDLMTHRMDMTVLWVEDTQDIWIDTICETNYSRYPVCTEDMDQIIGVLHVRDLMCKLRDGGSIDIKKLLRPAYMVPETVKADDLLRQMQQSRAHMSIVVDEYGGTSGVVTMEDILEEIVGQIEDEHDEPEPEIIELSESKWRVSGSILLDALSEELCIQFPEGEYETLGGLIYSTLNVIPLDGSRAEVDIAGVHIEIEEIKDRRVKWAVLTIAAKNAADGKPEE